MFDFSFVCFFLSKLILKYLNRCAHGNARKSSSNPVKSQSINQSKICSKFQRCTYNSFENLLKVLAFFP